MKRISLTILFMSIIALASTAQQIIDTTEKEQYDGLRKVALARQIIMMGYNNQDPIFLMTGALTLADFPVKGKWEADSVQLEKAEIAVTLAGAREVGFDPYELLDDAKRMAGADTLMLAMLDRARLNVADKLQQGRGRKFSPLAQEYLLDADGSVKLWETFNANEVAEIFVMGDGNSEIDLFLYDKNGNLIASDPGNIDNCYVSCIPQTAVQFRIEIRNSGKKGNHCLLLTN